MKKIIGILIVIFCVLSCVGCSNASEEVIRIHIRANSNSDIDQGIKLVVRDNIIKYITPLIAECQNAKEVKSTLESNLNGIESVADRVLIDNGFEYISSARISNEYFPSREYDGHVFDAGYYNALILNLGSGIGNNWWCVAYPPLCFVGEDNNSAKIEYKSKILELIENFFGR